MAAEVLGVEPEAVHVYSSDTDRTPFDVGAYASSTTYVSGGAVIKAAEKVRDRFLHHAGVMLDECAEELVCERGRITAPSGKSVAIADVARVAMYGDEKEQVSASASNMTFECPPPFAAAVADVEVDVETGRVDVRDFACAIDCGFAINPALAEGQIQGGVSMGLGYALSEEMLFDSRGKMLNANLIDYKVLLGGRHSRHQGDTRDHRRTDGSVRRQERLRDTRRRRRAGDRQRHLRRDRRQASRASVHAGAGARGDRGARGRTADDGADPWPRIEVHPLPDIYHLATMNDAGDRLSGVDVLIDGNRIARIGRRSNLCRGSASIDCSSMLVLPGLVNLHHHFYQTLQRNVPPAQNQKLFDWLTTLYDIWAGLSRRRGQGKHAGWRARSFYSPAARWRATRCTSSRAASTRNSSTSR